MSFNAHSTPDSPYIALLWPLKELKGTLQKSPQFLETATHLYLHLYLYLYLYSPLKEPFEGNLGIS